MFNPRARSPSPIRGSEPNVCSVEEPLLEAATRHIDRTHLYTRVPRLIHVFAKGAHFRLNLGPTPVTERVSLKLKQHERLQKLYDLYSSFTTSSRERWKARLLANRCFDNDEYILERLLTFLLRAKWSYKKAAEQLDQYLESVKTMTEFFGVSVEELQTGCILTSGAVVFGGVDREGTRSIIIMPALHTVTPDGSNEMLDIKAALYLCSLSMNDQYERRQWQHVSLVIDLGGSSMRNNVDLNLFSEIVKTLDRVYPLVIKSLIIMDANAFFKGKVKKLGLSTPIIYVKNKQISKKMLEIFPKAEVPVEYGGSRTDILCPLMVDHLRRECGGRDFDGQKAKVDAPSEYVIIFAHSLSSYPHSFRAGSARRRGHRRQQSDSDGKSMLKTSSEPAKIEEQLAPLYSVGPYVDLEFKFDPEKAFELSCEKGENLTLRMFKYNLRKEDVLVMVCQDLAAAAASDDGVDHMVTSSTTKFTVGARNFSREEVALYKERALREYLARESSGRRSTSPNPIHLQGIEREKFTAKRKSTKLFSNQMMAGATRAASVAFNLPPHPNVLQLKGAVFSPSTFMFVLACAKTPLSSRLQSLRMEGKGLSFSEILSIAIDVVHGLKHLHDNDVVLKTLSTNAVWLTVEGRAVIVETALDNVLDALELRTARYRSITWLAPEIIDSNGNITPSADVYSLGLLLVALLIGSDPFCSTHQAEVDKSVALIMEGRRPSIPPHTNARYAAIIKSCWKSAPSDRPSIKKVLKALKRVDISKTDSKTTVFNSTLLLSPGDALGPTWGSGSPSPRASGSGVQALKEFLANLGLEDQLDNLTKESVTLDSLLLMEREDLVQMGLPLGPQKTLLAALGKTGRHPQMSRVVARHRQGITTKKGDGGFSHNPSFELTQQEAPVGTYIQRSRGMSMEGGKGKGEIGTSPRKKTRKGRGQEKEGGEKEEGRRQSTLEVRNVEDELQMILSGSKLPSAGNILRTEPGTSQFKGMYASTANVDLNEAISVILSTSDSQTLILKSGGTTDTVSPRDEGPQPHPALNDRRNSKQLAHIRRKGRFSGEALASPEEKSKSTPPLAMETIKDDRPSKSDIAKSPRKARLDEGDPSPVISRPLLKSPNSEPSGLTCEGDGAKEKLSRPFGLQTHSSKRGRTGSPRASDVGATPQHTAKTSDGQLEGSPGSHKPTNTAAAEELRWRDALGESNYGEAVVSGSAVYGEGAGLEGEDSSAAPSSEGSCGDEEMGSTANYGEPASMDVYRSQSFSSSEDSETADEEAKDATAPFDGRMTMVGEEIAYKKLTGKAGTVQERMRRRQTDFGIRQIHQRDITMSPIPLAAGGFGTVFKGSWKGLDVAIKQLTAGVSSVRKKQEFVQEALLMNHIGCHRNIVALYGVILDNDEWYMVTELAERGSVYDALIRNQPDVPLELVLRIARDTAEGLAFLHASGVIHRDMAARNVLLSRNYQVLLTDFGLSRAMDDVSFGQTVSKIGPIKWMAPEAIDTQRYSPATDAWSYGVFLWEIATQAVHGPFHGRMLLDVAAMVVKQRLRLEPPDDCHQTLADVMKLCWEWDPKARITMLQARDAVGAAYDSICEETGSYGLFL